MRRSHAFTIIELLIVVSIIAVLASILLPVVNKVRMAAMQTSCLSNMRQLTSGVLAYAADNGGQIPYCNWNNGVDDTGNGQYARGWLFCLPQYRTNFTPTTLNGAWHTLPHYPIEGPMTGCIWPYVKSLSPYHCPIDNPDFWVGTEWLTSYLFNGAQCAYGGMPPGSPGLQLRQVKSPRTGIMLWEVMEQRYEGGEAVGAIWNDGSSAPFEEKLADRHYKGANVTFYDGHAEWWDAQAWYTWVNKHQYTLN